MAEHSLNSLIGGELAGVHFVRDYVEFYFDGPIVRALENPVVAHDGGRVAFPDAGSRDALCSLIGRTLVALNVQEDVELQLEFNPPARVTINLDLTKARGPECLHFVPSRGKPMEVW